MAYNSDGYIMIDFAEVDFSKTNQTIDGLFERCQKVIGTNKFVSVINANGKTPLPSTVCITNGQYVIESVLFTFSISSSDNLHITKKTTPEELIDDNHVTLKTTFSSNKIMSLLDGTIKSFSYTGTGDNSLKLNMPEGAKYILSIQGNVEVSGGFNSWYSTSFIDLSHILRWLTVSGGVVGSGHATRYYSIVSYVDNVLLMSTTTANAVLNALGGEYTVYYI